MGVVAKNIVGMYTTTTGVDTLTLTSAAPKHITFVEAGLADGATVSYVLHDGNDSEVGRGVVGNTGTTLTRATVLSSTNSGNKIALTGNAVVYVTLAVEDLFGLPELTSPAEDRLLFWNDATGAIETIAPNAATTLASAAPETGTYFTASAVAGLANEVNLGGLTTGLLKLTVAAGTAVPSIAVAGTDFVSPAAIIGLAKGGLGVALNDPDADRLLFWDDSAQQMAFLALGGGLNLVGTLLSGAAIPTYSIFNYTSLNAVQTWNRPTGCRAVYFKACGGGGQGGGCPATVAATATAGSGGGAGACSEGIIDVTSIATLSVIVGNGGTAGAVGAAGANGGPTSISSAGLVTHVSCPGGVGGAVGVTAAATPYILAGALPSAVSSGISQFCPVYGAGGENACRLSATVIASGKGADSPLGAGGVSLTVSNTGNAALGYGSGGGGALNTASLSARAGGAGGNGIVIFKELY